MKIAHISDIHIRTLKYHSEYKKAFADLYEDFLNVKPDIIVNTGDTVHSKISLSPELVEITSEHFRSCANIAPLYVILGNHDLNLMNPDRQDAITPIIENLKGNTKYPIFLMKKSGKVPVENFPGTYFLVYSITDSENYPSVSDTMTRDSEDDIFIGLFHGSIGGCVTDQDWKMTSAEQNLSLFGGCDYVLMGDIHKQQFFGYDKKIAYAGSLIQQNFGEETKKGYLFWDIETKTKHSVELREIKGTRKFYTIRLNDDLSIPKMDIEPNSHIRIISPTSLSFVETKNIEREVKNTFSPKDIISTTSPDTTFEKKKTQSEIKDIENIRSLSVQDKLIRKFFKGKNIDEHVMDKIAEINKSYQIEIEKNEEVIRNVFWKVNKIGWTNMFNYGEDNFIDFNKIPGLTGIFAPNTSGKSSVFEIFMEALFDKVTKEVSRNIELINDNKDEAKMIVDLTIGNEDFIIERGIERIKYGQRKSEIKEAGKMSLDFYLSDNGEKISLNGSIRSETEKNIRRKIGSFEDFVLTTISAQEPIQGLPGGANLILCKETDRKKILFRFLDLDIFDDKCVMAKDASKQFFNKFKELEETDILGLCEKTRQEKFDIELTISDLNKLIDAQEKSISNVNQQITHHKALLVNVSFNADDKEAKEKKLKQLRKQEDVLFEKRKKAKELLGGIEDKILDKIEEKNLLKHSSLSKEQLAETDKRFVELVKKQGKLENELDKLLTQVAEKKVKIKLLDEVPCEGQYPKCKFLINAFNAKDEIPSNEDRISELSEQIGLNKLDIDAMTKLREEIKAAQTIENDLASLSLDERSAKIAIKEIENDAVKLDSDCIKLTAELQDIYDVMTHIENNKEVKAKILEYERLCDEYKQELNAKTKSLGLLNQKLGATSSSLERFETSLKEFEELKTICSAYEHYIEAMGKHGIAYGILADKLPIINDEINKILSNVVDFSVFLEHDQQEQTIRLYLQYGDYKSRNLGLASGAEKFLSSLAIRAALLNVTSLPKTNMFVVDEGFGKLDPIHLEAIQKMFDYLRSIFDHVVIISHVDTLKDMVDNNIEISSDSEGYAHVAVE